MICQIYPEVLLPESGITLGPNTDNWSNVRDVFTICPATPAKHSNGSLGDFVDGFTQQHWLEMGGNKATSVSSEAFYYIQRIKSQFLKLKSQAHNVPKLLVHILFLRF